MNAKNKYILFMLAIAMLFYASGYITRWRLDTRTRASLVEQLDRDKEAIRQYKERVDSITAGIGEYQSTIERANTIIANLRRELAESREQLATERRKTEQAISGIGTVQQGLGGIAAEANSGIGIVDACFDVYKDTTSDDNSN